jgi:hypothetical protein
MPEEELVYKIFETYNYKNELGIIRLEQWSNGFKLWVKDQYVWQSWEDEGDIDKEIGATPEECNKLMIEMSGITPEMLGIKDEEDANQC